MDLLKFPKPSIISEAWWTEVCKKVKNAVVFLDDFAAESLHWVGGLERLLKNGCKDVKEFSSFETCKATDEKAVFLLGTLIHGLVLDTLRDITKSSQFKYVVLITGAHPSVHAYAAFGGREVDEKSIMNQLEEKILEWMGNLNYTVEIFYFPVTLVEPVEDVFLWPQFYELSSIYEDEISDILKSFDETGRSHKKTVVTLEDLEFHHLPSEVRTSIFHLVVCLHTYLQAMNVREEIYSLGQLSRIVAEELETYNPARQRRKVAANKVSLVLVDRGLDLVAPADFDGSLLMNRILALLPRLPGHKVDSAVSLSPVSQVHSSCEWTLIPGCFAHPTQPKGKEIFQKSILNSKREMVNSIKEEVQNLMKQSEIKMETEEESGSADQLLSHLKSLTKEKTFKDNFWFVQQALTVVEVLKHRRNGTLDQLHSLEKMLLHVISDPDAEQSPFKEVLQLLKTRNKKGVKTEEVLALFIYLASLGSSAAFEGASEYAFTNAFSQAFMEDKERDCLEICSIFGVDVDEVSALKTANRIWHRLVAIAKARERLKDYRDLYGRESDMEPYKYRSLLSQVVEDCLNPPQQPVTDLEYKSAGFKDMIKTGFSLFVNVSKPRPKDAPVMIIYVLGGITPSEIRDIKDLIGKHRPKCQVLVGSSHLTYPSDVVQQCFKKQF